MATSIGHGIAGAAVAQALGMGPRATAAAFVLSSAPDLDIPLGLLLEGDAGAYHRAWWTHSPVFALAAAALTLGVVLAWPRLTSGRRDPRRAARWALFVGLVQLSHTVTDFVLVNPLRALRYPGPDPEDATDLGTLLQAIAGELLQFGGDVVFYGAIALAALWALRRYGPRRTAA